MHKVRPAQGRKGLHLRAPFGSDYLVEPDDIVDTKRALMALDYYQPLPGTEPGAFVDNRVFAGIKAFQRDQGLKVDGLMRPGGETETALNEALAYALPARPKPDGEGANDNQPPANENCQTAGLPWFGPMFRIDGKGGGQCPPPRGPEENEGDCDELLDKDEEICRNLRSPRGRAICWETAYQRHAACIAGRPMPPLLTGDWPGDD